MKYGGHRSAVGFTIDTSKIDIFRERLHDIVMRELEKFTEKKVLEIYDVLSPDELTPEFYQELQIFEPTGPGNPAPVFSILGTSVINPVAIGKEKNHIRFYIPASWGIVPVVGWGFAEKTFRVLEETELVDIAFAIDQNRFRGESNLQLVLHDIRISGKSE
jgi:single-stranded-DNA-specific exonuclease